MKREINEVTIDRLIAELTAGDDFSAEDQARIEALRASWRSVREKIVDTELRKLVLDEQRRFIAEQLDDDDGTAPV